jgi:hypothetical protein
MVIAIRRSGREAMALFGRREQRSEPLPGGRNMLPRDNVYTVAAMRANEVYRENGWAIRVAAVRMLTPGQLEVALAVPSNNSEPVEMALNRLPGHEPVFSVVAGYLAFCHHPVRAFYGSETDWAEVSQAAGWQYHG